MARRKASLTVTVVALMAGQVALMCLPKPWASRISAVEACVDHEQEGRLICDGRVGGRGGFHRP